MKIYKDTSGNNDLSNLPPQAAAIVEEIRSKGVIQRDELLKTLEARFVQHYRQSPKHVLSFYKGRLIKDGLMIEVTI